MSKGSGSRCEADGRVSRRLTGHQSSSDTLFCVVLAPFAHTCIKQIAMHGHHGNRVCACFLGFSVAYDCIRAGLFGSPTEYTLAPYSNMLRYTLDYGRASSRYNRDWAPPAKQHTKNRYSGWSKRATRGHHSGYDEWSRQWEDSKPSNSTMDNEVAAEIVTEAEVEVVESRDRNRGCLVAKNAVGVTQATAACDSIGLNDGAGYCTIEAGKTLPPPQQSKGKSQRNL